MSYLQDRRNKKNKIRYAIFGIVVLILVYFYNSIFGGISYFANGIFKPVVRIADNISQNFSTAKTFFTSKESLQKENENLKQELAMEKGLVANYQTIQDDNNRLKEILGRKSENSKQILSGVLIKPNVSLYDTLLIDAGSNNGVARGDLVFADGNIPIGKVSEVFNTSAKVVLFSTSGERTSVVIDGSGVSMDMIGRGGGNFEMTLPRDFDVKEGAEVTLPGINSYLVAKIVTIISDPHDSFKKVLLVSPSNFQELKFVEVQK